MDNNETTQAPVESQEKRGGGKKILIILVIIAVFILAGWYAFGRGGASTLGTDAGASVALPTSWPNDVPMYAGATVSYVAAANNATVKQGVAAILQTSDDSTTVATFYKTALEAKGWKLGAPSESAAGIAFGGEKDTRQLSVNIATANNLTTITLAV